MPLEIRRGMVDINLQQNKILAFLGVFIGVCILAILVTTPQNPYLNFEGALGFPYTVSSNDVNLNFKADNLVVCSDVAVYRYVNGIIIEKDGLFEPINESHLEVRYKDNNCFSIKNATASFVFDDYARIEDFNGYMNVVGSASQNYYKAIESDTNASITSSSIESVSINGVEYLEDDFDRIYINIGTGYVDLFSEQIIFFVYGVSDYVLSSSSVDSLYMQGSEGNLAIDGDLYTITNVNVVDFSLTNTPYSTNFLIKNSVLSISSTAKSVLIDENEIVKSKILYLYDKQTEKIIALATVILVGITFHYAYSTHRILDQSTRTEKRSYIEKRLEYLYYPLRDFLSSREVFRLYYYQELLEASGIEELAKENARENGVQYIRPCPSILTDYDVLNTSAKRYDLDSIIPYQYLATNKLVTKLELLLSDFRDIETIEPASSDPDFKNRIDEIKLLVDSDIKELLQEHKELI